MVGKKTFFDFFKLKFFKESRDSFLPLLFLFLISFSFISITHVPPSFADTTCTCEDPGPNYQGDDNNAGAQGGGGTYTDGYNDSCGTNRCSVTIVCNESGSGCFSGNGGSGDTYICDSGNGCCSCSYSYSGGSIVVPDPTVPPPTPTPTAAPACVATPSCGCGNPPDGMSSSDGGYTYGTYNDSCGHPTCGVSCSPTTYQWIYGDCNCGVSAFGPITCAGSYCPTDQYDQSSGQGCYCAGSSGSCNVTGGTAGTTCPSTPTPTPTPTSCAPANQNTCYDAVPNGSTTLCPVGQWEIVQWDGCGNLGNVTCSSTSQGNQDPTGCASCCNGSGGPGPSNYSYQCLNQCGTTPTPTATPPPTPNSGCTTTMSSDCSNNGCTSPSQYLCVYIDYGDNGNATPNTSYTCSNTDTGSGSNQNYICGPTQEYGCNYVTTASYGCSSCAVTSGTGGNCGGGTTPTPTSTPVSGTISVSPAPSPFSTVIVSNLSPMPVDPVQHTQNFTFQNNSTTSSVTICTASLGDTTNFSIPPGTDHCSGQSLNPGGTCVVTVKGNPQTTNPFTTTLSATYGNCGSSPTSVSTGNITEKGETWPNFVVTPISPQSHEYGTIGPTTPPSQMTTAVTITNTGTLKATNCTVVGVEDSTDFVPDHGCDTVPSSTAGGTCPVNVSVVAPSSGGTTTYHTSLKISCAGTGDSNPIYANNNTGAYFFVAQTQTASASPPAEFQFETACSVLGQYVSSTTNQCQCPAGYEVTSTFTQQQACRPILPSLEFFKAPDSANQSDGFPVCGAGRLPTGLNYEILTTAGYWQPNSSDNVVNQSIPFTFWNADGPSNSNPSPNYIYGQSIGNAQRCVCSENAYVLAPKPATPGTYLPQNGTFPVSNGVRFAPDTYETIVQETSTNNVPYGPVVLAADNVSNGYIGSTYQAGYQSGAVSCGCPNVNEHRVIIDPTNLSGEVCQSMMAADTVTQNYKILTTYNPTTHAAPIKQSTEAPGITTVKVPTQTMNYKNYTRKIWTCAPPFEQVVNGTSIACVFTAADNLCDDGSGATTAGAGIPSAVSMNMTGTPLQKFQKTVNKRLACCVNEFDPTNLNVRTKFDCVDNSAASYPGFDDLWAKNPTEGLPNALALTSASGQLMTGFYTLSGTRCNEFSEFGGTITGYRLNQQTGATQQTMTGAGTMSDETPTGYSVTPPAEITGATGWTSFLQTHKVPTSAADMRRCPILVRAAMKATCPNNGTPPAVSGSYPTLPSTLQTYNDAGTVRCSVASQVNIYLRVEQIYELGGMTKMSTIDSVTDSRQAVSLPVSDWIKSKTAGNCADGAVLMSDGTCGYQ